MGCKGLEPIVELMHFQGRGLDRGHRIRPSLAAWREDKVENVERAVVPGDFSQYFVFRQKAKADYFTFPILTGHLAPASR